MTRGHPKLEVVLFDLGGILARLRDPAETFGMPMTRQQFNETWLRSAAVREFERGGIDTTEFATRAIAELRVEISVDEFVRRFDRWLHSLYPGAIDLIRSIPGDYETAILSNINALHWGRSDIGPTIEREVDKAFVSFETGVVKPDEAAFRQVTDHFHCRPDEVFFLDDHPINTDAASAFGMRAVNCVGIENVRAALIAAEIL